VFRLAGWVDETGMVATLTVGCVVAIAASISGDTSQDLKTGFLLGATPRRQQIGELIGVVTSATAVCATVILLDKSLGLGTKELSAPQATLMKLVIEGVLQGALPWALVGIGAGITIVMELIRIPSLPFAVGVYLPVSTMVPVFFGGMLRWLVERRSRSDEDRAARRENGVLFGSGLVGGEGLLGVVIAGVTLWQNYPPDPTKKNLPLPLHLGSSWAPEPVTMLVGAAIMVALAAYFYGRCRVRA
jgi:putative OPT family oligopeptide transporter